MNTTALSPCAWCLAGRFALHWLLRTKASAPPHRSRGRWWYCQDHSKRRLSCATVARRGPRGAHGAEGGEPGAGEAMRSISTLPPMISRQIQPEPMSGCWLWSGTCAQGYGKLYVPKARVSLQAHRITYELLVGRVPEGLVLDHLCRVTACVNPDHLEPVTNRENILRGTGWSARHARATHCVEGHEFTHLKNGRRRCRLCINRWFRERRIRRDRIKLTPPSDTPCYISGCRREMPHRHRVKIAPRVWPAR